MVNRGSKGAAAAGRSELDLAVVSRLCSRRESAKANVDKTDSSVMFFRDSTDFGRDGRKFSFGRSSKTRLSCKSWVMEGFSGESRGRWRLRGKSLGH